MKNLTNARADDGTSELQCVHEHFRTHASARGHQILAWRDRLSHFLDVPVSHAQIDNGFLGTIDSYRVHDLIFMDCRTDPVSQARTVANISVDNVRQYVFHAVVEGCIETRAGLYPQHTAMQTRPGILALDMNQPMLMQRPACRVMALFVPRTLVESILPDAESIHGRVIEYTSPLARMIPAWLTELALNLPTMTGDEAYDAIRTCALLIATAFGKQTRLHGNARNAARAAVFGMARQYIQANLCRSDLSPESVLKACQVSRPTLYRMFEHEGGLATYIRNRRLREAANELRAYPDKNVIEIAFDWGFNSASDFNHAFRRAYDMSPLDFRVLAVSGTESPTSTRMPREPH